MNVCSKSSQKGVWLTLKGHDLQIDGFVCLYISLHDERWRFLSHYVFFLFAAPVGQWPDKTRSPQMTGENLTETSHCWKAALLWEVEETTQAFLTSRASLLKSGLRTILNGRCRETAALRCVTFIWITLRRSTHQNQPLSTCAWHMAVYLDQIPSIPPCC